MWKFRILETDYESFIIKATEEGTYLMMANPADKRLMNYLIAKYKVKGVAISQDCQKTK